MKTLQDLIGELEKQKTFAGLADLLKALKVIQEENKRLEARIGKLEKQEKSAKPKWGKKYGQALNKLADE